MYFSMNVLVVLDHNMNVLVVLDHNTIGALLIRTVGDTPGFL
jgi:hypothetical protein